MTVSNYADDCYFSCTGYDTPDYWGCPENDTSGLRGCPDMTLALCSVLPDNSLVFMSDSRSTHISLTGEVSFSDTEQKIFYIEKSELVLLLTGSNRFTTEDGTIAPLVKALETARSLSEATEITAEFLREYHLKEAVSAIVIFPLKNSTHFVQVHNHAELSDGIITNRTILTPGSLYSFGSVWVTTLAKRLQPCNCMIEPEINRLSQFFASLYQLENSLQKDQQTLGGDLQILTKKWQGNIEFFTIKLPAVD